MQNLYGILQTKGSRMRLLATCKLNTGAHVDCKMAESGGSSASASASASGEASASGDGPSRSTSEAANIGFDVWVRSHGGDEQFISILHSHGFHSILSLGELETCSYRIRSNYQDTKNIYGWQCLIY